jgi:hypothetical protein
MYIDQSVYPDLDVPPASLDTDEDKADYLHRICAAWDFGIPPEQETFELFSGWESVFDAFPVITSPAYHAFRAWFGWDAIPYPRNVSAPVPRWVRLDELEGRELDPCAGMI